MSVRVSKMKPDTVEGRKDVFTAVALMEEEG